MIKKKKKEWNSGDVFLVPLKNGKYAIGQILDLQMPNIVRVALFDEIVTSLDVFKLSECCSVSNLISLVASSREQLDYDVWKLMGTKQIDISKKSFPNEEFRKKKWVGATHYDAAILEDFLNSFYALLPWDDWFNPNYLDNFLIDVSKKPTNLIYKKAPK
jgi:hypothetical protein